MEAGRTRVALAFICVSFFIPSTVFGYAKDTHKGISTATIQKYEQLRGGIFGSGEERKIIDGSFDEDAGTRPLNHFLDPIKSRGLSVLGVVFPSSKVWALDTVGQGEYCDFLVCPSRIDYTDKLFVSPTDFSWDRAVYEYVHGDRERGLQTLGHILHLLQDATVPAHVRNDQHLNHQGFGDPDPYEEYTSQFIEGGVAIPIIASVPHFESFPAAAEVTANFTNQNFLSEDTFFEGFSSPDINNLVVKENFGYSSSLGHKVYYRKVAVDQFGSEKITLILDDPDDSVMKDYWNLLSREAITNGVGVIDLFFREVEKEKQTKALLAKNVSQFEKHKEAIKEQVAIVKNALGIKTNQQEVAVPPVISQEVQSVVAVSQRIQEAPAPAPILKEEIVTVPAPKPVEAEIAFEEKEPEADAPTPSPGIPELFAIPLGAGGGGPPPVQEDEVIADTTAPSAPVIASPAANSSQGTTTLNISGTAEASARILLGYTYSGATTTATTTVLGDGSWSIPSLLFEESEQTLYVSATDSSGNTSATTTHIFRVDVTAPQVNTFTLLQCDTPLISGSCISTGRVDTKLTATSSDVSYYSLVVDGAVISTSTSPLMYTTLGVGLYGVSLAAYDAAGNGATSTAQTVSIISTPLVINEVAWSGASASVNDQWVEIYNNSTSTVSLSSVYLSDTDGTFALPLTGTLASGAYYLAERVSGTTNVTADALIEFPALTATPKALSILYAPGGLATTTLDQTPDASACSGAWCGGSTGATTTSMERKRASVSGTTTTNWISNNTYTKNGLDRASNTLYGTPKAKNSESLLTIGYFCPPYSTTFIESGYYQPNSGSCTYLSSEFSGNRYGDIYAGVIASSTIINGHALGINPENQQSDDTIPNPYQGMDILVAIYRVYSGQDITDFRAYFQSGSNPPPHLDYGVLRFKWGI